jgi:uncharacterized protein
MILKIALIGATGMVGSRVLNEALQRGHHVTALVRDVSRLPSHANLIARSVDINNVDALTEALRGHDAVLYAYKPSKDQSMPARIGQHAQAISSTIMAMKAAGLKRIVAVGGAGTLEASPGVLNMHSPDFPPRWEGGAKSTAMVKDLLKYEKTLDWSVLSPAHHLEPGQRTGKFRLGLDQMIIGADGQSRIFIEDFAVAMLDEVETPKHIGQRFTLGY